MPNRSEPITRLPLAEPGQRVPKEVVERIESEHLRNLKDDVPVLDHLRASTLSTDYELTNEGLKLLVLLKESDQVPIAFASGLPGRAQTTADPYMEDVADARRQMAQVAGRIVIACSGAASPLDGTKDTPQAPSTATVRRRVLRGLDQGGVLVPGLPDARPLFVDTPPSTLPQAVPVTITARVKRLETETAFLVGVRLVDAKGSGLTLKAAASKEFAMTRPGPFQKVAPGTVLQVAMDSDARIRLDVLAALDWASGAPVAFELVRLPE
jgi:hypothetical protein